MIEGAINQKKVTKKDKSLYFVVNEDITIPTPRPNSAIEKIRSGKNKIVF